MANFELVFAPLFLKQYDYWGEHNPKIVTRIDALVQAIVQDPFRGIGKPEPLRYELTGCWSRRIDREHRLVYRVDADTITFLQCRKHY